MKNSRAGTLKKLVETFEPSEHYKGLVASNGLFELVESGQLDQFAPDLRSRFEAVLERWEPLFPQPKRPTAAAIEKQLKGQIAASRSARQRDGVLLELTWNYWQWSKFDAAVIVAEQIQDAELYEVLRPLTALGVAIEVTSDPDDDRAPSLPSGSPEFDHAYLALVDVRHNSVPPDDASAKLSTVALRYRPALRLCLANAISRDWNRATREWELDDTLAELRRAILDLNDLDGRETSLVPLIGSPQHLTDSGRYFVLVDFAGQRRRFDIAASYQALSVEDVLGSLEKKLALNDLPRLYKLAALLRSPERRAKAQARVVELELALR